MRPAEQTDLIWGRHPVDEALRSGRAVKRLYLARGLRPAEGLAQTLALAQERGVIIEEMDRSHLDLLTGTSRHQGIAARVSPLPPADVQDILDLAARRQEPPLILALDSVQDPQNLGTLLRTAEAVGAHGVILPKHRAAGITGAVVKASAGAAQWLTVAEVTNLVRALRELKEKGVWVMGLDMEGTIAYDEVDASLPLVLVVGSESRGLGRLVREQCDFVARLPMRGHVESLNAAVAGSIVLYQLWRQRDRGQLPINGKSGEQPGAD